MTSPISAPTPRPHPVIHALFAYDGRIGRLPFAIGFVSVFAVALALIFFSVALAGNDRSGLVGGFSAAALIVALGGLWPLSALLIKRLHDLRRSGWHACWLVPLWLIPNLLDEPLSTLAMIAALAALLWIVAMPGNERTTARDA